MGAPPGFKEDAPPGFKEDAPSGSNETKMEVDEEEEKNTMQRRTLFVINIPKALKYEQQLEKMCQEFGEVASIRCPRKKKGKILKGFGYIEFATVEASQKALTGLQGKQLGKKIIQVQRYRDD